jgi:pantoate--beta-alanine ligase
MRIIEKIDILKKERKLLEGKSIGFVPTMGYLHDGHLSLVDKSKEENKITVVSIYVNPTQFGPHEDLDRYPRDLLRDSQMLRDRAVDYLFYPDSGEMYRENFSTFVVVEKLGSVLCGRSRPTHFKGVTTVVMKLFNIIRPSRAYFGLKDAQQAIIIKRMVGDLNIDTTIRVLPTIRDRDGLALSSRNAYLSKKDRQAAFLLPRTLEKVRKMIRNGLEDVGEIKKKIRRELEKDPMIKIEYVEVVDLNRLENLEKINPDSTLVAVAIRVGETRLIDNFVLGEI